MNLLTKVTSLCIVAAVDFWPVATQNPNSDEPLIPHVGKLGQLRLTSYGKLWWWNGEQWRGDVGIMAPAEFGRVGLMPPSLDGACWYFIVNGNASNPVPADNVLRWRNDDQRHYSAAAIHCALADGGWEVGAIGYGNSQSSPIYRGNMFIESYSGDGDICFFIGSHMGTAGKFQRWSGDFIQYAPNNGSGNGPETFHVVRATGDVYAAGNVTAPNISALQTRVTELEQRLQAAGIP